MFVNDKGGQKKLRIIKIVGKLAEEKCLWNSMRDKSKAGDLHRESIVQTQDEDSGGTVSEE